VPRRGISVAQTERLGLTDDEKKMEKKMKENGESRAPSQNGPFAREPG
jgi:hypothetical protein